MRYTTGKAPTQSDRNEHVHEDSTLRMPACVPRREPATETPTVATATLAFTKKTSDRLLQRGHAECLHHGASWLGLDHHHLPEDLPLASLGRRLLPGLQHAEAGNGELAVALHLLRAHRRLQLGGLGEGTRDPTLRQSGTLHPACQPW